MKKNAFTILELLITLALLCFLLSGLLGLAGLCLARKEKSANKTHKAVPTAVATNLVSLTTNKPAGL